MKLLNKRNPYMWLYVLLNLSIDRLMIDEIDCNHSIAYKTYLHETRSYSMKNIIAFQNILNNEYLGRPYGPF